MVAVVVVVSVGVVVHAVAVLVAVVVAVVGDAAKWRLPTVVVTASLKSWNLSMSKSRFLGFCNAHTIPSCKMFIKSFFEHAKYAWIWCVSSG